MPFFAIDEFEGDIIPDGYVTEVANSGNDKRSLLIKRGYLRDRAEQRKWIQGKVYYIFSQNVPRGT